MADTNPDPKTTTIDDLVNQLSRQKSNQPPTPAGPPANLPGFKVGTAPAAAMPSSPTVPPAPKPPVMPPMPPKPAMPSMPAPAPRPITPPAIMPKPVVPSPMPPPLPPTSGPKEYKSSIRTMTEDLASLKAGQKPSGVEIPRKVESEKPMVPGPMPAPRPAIPVAPFRPAVELGKAQKSGVAPISIPPEEKKGLSPMFYLIVVGILVIGGFLYWFFILRTPSEVALSPTPVPSTTATPVPLLKLSDIFSATPENFETTSGKDSSNDFKAFVDTLNVDSGNFLPIKPVQAQPDGSVTQLNFFDMMDQSLVLYPADVKANLGSDSIVVAYGQKEAFTKTGQLDLVQTGLKRTIVVTQVKNKSAIAAALSGWEATMAQSVGKFILPSGVKAATKTFLDNSYRGVAIRYMNFPFPDISIDYALVTVGQNDYLVFAGSREAMLAAIDQLSSQSGQ